MAGDKEMQRIEVHPDLLEEKARLVQQKKQELERMVWELEKSIYMLQSDWSGVTGERFFWDFMQVKEVFPTTLGLLDEIQKEFTFIAKNFRTTDGSGEVALYIPEELKRNFAVGLLDKSVGETITGMGQTAEAFFENPFSTLSSVAYAMTVGKVVDVGRGIQFAWDTAWGTGTARSDIGQFVEEQKKQIDENGAGYYGGAMTGQALAYVLFGKAFRSMDDKHTDLGGAGGAKPEHGGIFKYNENLKLTEIQQKKISEYIGVNSDELISSGLASEDTLKKILKNLKEGSKSGREGFRLEADTAKLLLDNKIKITEAGTTYNAKELGGRIGEIDLGTSNYIIECFNATGGKSKSISDFFKYFEGDVKQPHINPDHKGVILYAPNGIDTVKAKNISSIGVEIVTSPEELINTLKGEKR
ncbi:WXG100 family type VII secretion target [Paenibacillus sp. W2I17]|nr:WXG100 family type VII secretion target [Paenibacillus sp. W2I17]